MSDVRHTRLLIIGSGPAGYTAAVYGARAMLEPILIQGIQPGGQLTITTEVENWPGDVEVQGPALMERMEAHAQATGAEIVADHIARLELDKRPFTAIGDGGTVYTADAVVLATGAQAKWLGLPSEETLQGLRRLGLRHLRRLLLPRARGGGDRRRQHRGRGGAVPDQLRLQGDAGAPARRARARRRSCRSGCSRTRRSRRSGTTRSTRCWARTTRAG